jgi:putative serine protease PepD
MSDGSARGSTPSPRGPAGGLDSSGTADTARAGDSESSGDSGRDSDPPYPADLAEWHDLDYPPYLYDPDLDGPQAEGAAAARWRVARATSLGGSRLLIVILITAVLAALAGGLVGGYIGTSSSAGSRSDYTLGTVPPAMTNRSPSSVAGIAARVLPSVVMIRVNGMEGTGSGFIIQGGYIVTNYHVVTLDGQLSHTSLQVVYNGGQKEPARLVGSDPYSDIAVIKPERPTHLPALSLGNSGSVEVGDPVIAIGSPLGLAGTVTSGIVSALDRPVQPGASSGLTPQVFYDAIQTDAPINPGNSGGPLVNAQAQVIGVNAAIDTLGGNPATGDQGGSIGLGFAIPVNQARLVATQLIRTGKAAHSVLGALISTSYHGSGAQIALARTDGVPAVSPGGPAARAGLRPGDVIIRFGGQQIINATGLLDAVRSRGPGARVPVTFKRNGATRTVTLTLGSAESLTGALRG